jgi:hypothetical protein
LCDLVEQIAVAHGSLSREIDRRIELRFVESHFGHRYPHTDVPVPWASERAGSPDSDTGRVSNVALRGSSRFV